MNVTNKSKSNLVHNYSKWKNTETCTIRVPKVLKANILEYAHKIDEQVEDNNSYDSTVTHETVKIIINNIKAKKKGYKSNSASQLIKDLLSLVEEES